MPKKAKRKDTMRQRLLLRFCLWFLICIALIIGGIMRVQSTKVNIVFIAPDDKGVDNVWLADLNNPDHPRQLTNFEDSLRIQDLQVGKANDVIFFVRNNVLYYYNDNHLQEYTLLCDDTILNCWGWELHPHGDRVLFTSKGYSSDVPIDLHVFNFRTNRLETIFRGSEEQKIWPYGVNWVDDTHVIRAQYTQGTGGQAIKGGIEFDTASTQINYVADTGIYNFCQFPSPDDTHCAYNISDGSDPIAPELVGVFEIGSSERTIFPLDYANRSTYHSLSRVTAYFYGWHPDNEHFLLGENVTEIVDDQLTITGVDLNLYNLQTPQTFTTLTSIASFGYNSLVSFKADGSAILISTGYYHSDPAQIMQIDLMTGEETVLPLFGYSAQWVNAAQ